MKRYKVVLVGGAGFVGTWLAGRLLASGHEVLIVDKRRSEAFPHCSILGDVRDRESLRAAIPVADLLVNLAAEHRDDVRPLEEYTAVNVDGARNVVAIVRELGITRLVFTSSVACYGLGRPDAGEDTPLAPFNEYGRTKMLAEEIYTAWQREDTERWALSIVRPTVIFGEGNRGNVYNLLNQIARGRFVMIGSGRNRKSMAYVENVVAFLEYLLGMPPGRHVFNYVDKPDLEVREIVATTKRVLGRLPGGRFAIPYAIAYPLAAMLDVVARATGRTFPISAIRVKKFCATTQFASRAESTGFKAPVTLEEGLCRTIRYEFIEDNSGAPVFTTE